MTFKLISATPSPFARINRIAMLEKGIAFEIQNEVPWDPKETQTPLYNPLEKLPILLSPDDPTFEPVYDSSHIQHYLVEKFAHQGPRLLTGDLDLDLKAYQVQVLAQGILDAFVTDYMERARPEEKRSELVMARQGRKIDGGLTALNQMSKARKGDFLVGDGSVYTIADIAAGCAVAQIEFVKARPGWQKTYPALAAWFELIDARESHIQTRPVMFELKNPMV